MDAEFALKHGADFPYDAGEEWWDSSEGAAPPPPRDDAHATARGILADLTDRRGVKHELNDVDHEVRSELTETMAEIIRVGMSPK